MPVYGSAEAGFASVSLAFFDGDSVSSSTLAE
jgi:hypothetical protein